MIYLGYDPGLEGALVAIDDAGNVLYKGTNDKHLTTNIEVIRTVNPRESVAAREDLHAIYGAAAGTTFSLGRSCGFIDGLFTASGIEVWLIPVRDWQKELTTTPIWLETRGLSATDKAKIKRERKVNLKLESLRAANELYPGHGITNNNISDALLIATYLKNNYEKNGS